MPTIEIYDEGTRQAKINELNIKTNTLHQKIKDIKINMKGVNIGYSMDFVESFSRVVDYNRIITENLDIQRKLSKGTEKNINYNLTLEETVNKEIDKMFTEGLELQEQLRKEYTLILVENLDIQRKLSKEYTLILVENLDIQRKLSKELQKTFDIALDVVENYLRAAGTVMSDLTLYNVALNETNFDTAITPAGYDRFKTMLTGDYVYQKALFRFVLNSTTISGERPNCREYLHKVDVPDTFETGTIEFETDRNPATYKFKRKFHIVPEVTYTIIRVEGMEELNQATLLPLEVTTTHIKAQLKVGSKYVNGAVSFSARGY